MAQNILPKKTYNPPPSSTLKEVFDSKAVPGYDSDACWSWLGSVGKEHGYAVLQFQKKQLRASRVSWFLTHRTWPSLHVLHDCDNPRCSNPRHLFLGTDADNVRDKVQKGRQARGATHGRSKLTNEQVVDIYNNRHLGNARYFADLYSVRDDAIWRIWSQKTWKHVTEQL